MRGEIKASPPALSLERELKKIEDICVPSIRLHSYTPSLLHSLIWMRDER